jgi:integrase/recombinase XerD
MGKKELREEDECRDMIKDRIERVEQIKEGKSPDKWIRPLRWFDEHLDSIGVDDVADFESSDAEDVGFVISKAYNGTTRGFYWRRINDLFSWLEKRNDIDENPFDDWSMDNVAMDNKTAQSEYDPITLSQDQVRELEKNVGSPKLRNQCIVRMMFQSGLRRGEVAALTYKTDEDEIDDEEYEEGWRGDINFQQRELKVREEHAKNSLPRTTIYQPSLDGLLDRWLSERDIIGPDHDSLFCGVRGGNLTGEAVNDMVVKAAQKAEMGEVMYVDANGGERWSVRSHSLRKGFGTYLANKTDCDIFQLSKIMGHQSVDITVEKYVEHDDEAGTDHGHRFGPE